MTVLELEKNISELRSQLSKLQSQVSTVSKNLKYLNEQKNLKMRKGFVDYIEIGKTYQFRGWTRLKGTQTGLKKGEFGFESNFNTGDTIEFIKKNKNSIVIKVINFRMVRKGGQITDIHGTTFRIDIESLYYVMVSDEVFYKNLINYISREEALSSLLD